MNFYSVVFKHTDELLYDVVEFGDNGVVVIYCPTRKDVKTYNNIDCLKCIIDELSEDIELVKEGVIEDDNDEEEEQLEIIFDDEKEDEPSDEVQIEQFEKQILEIRNVIDKLRHRGI